ncbi:MAG: energy transducer TonB [Candidatus Eisenbacteria bacterium]|nr:energy transducer TonB [Candidatus Eisenbacteria bacterium]
MRIRRFIAVLAFFVPAAAALRCADDTNGPQENSAPLPERIYCSVFVGENQNPALETVAFVIERDDSGAEPDSLVRLYQDLIPPHPFPENACALESLYVGEDSVFFRIPAGMGYGMACPGWRFSSRRDGESIGGAAVSCDTSAADSLRWAGVACPCDGGCESEPESAATYSHPPLVRRLYLPTYPSLAQAAGIEGTVVAEVFIDRCGEIVHAEIAQTPSEIFEQSVLAALQLAAFHPARAGTLFVRSRVLIPFKFCINDAKGKGEADIDERAGQILQISAISATLP